MKGKFYDIAEEFLTQEIINSVPDMDDHVFSRRYRKRREELIGCRGQTQAVSIKCRPRLKYIIAAVIFACAAAFTAAVSYKYLGGFGLYNAPDKRSYVIFAKDDIHAKDIITERAYFSADMSGYRIKENGFRDIYHCLSYEKDDMVIHLEQFTDQSLDFLSVSVNTEKTVNPPEKININGYDGMFFTTRNNSNNFFFYMNGYIISVSASEHYSRETLEELVRSIEFEK